MVAEFILVGEFVGSLANHFKQNIPETTIQWQSMKEYWEWKKNEQSLWTNGISLQKHVFAYINI